MQRPRTSISNHSPVVHGGKNAICNISDTFYNTNYNTDYNTNYTQSNIIDFSANINPLGCPAQVLDALRTRLDDIVDYPDPNSSEAYSALSNYLKLNTENIILGNGATEIIYNFCNAFLTKSKVLVHIPTFLEYEKAALLAAAKVSKFSTMNLAKDVDQFISNIPKLGCVFVCNPNNPTGTIISKKKIIDIIDAANSVSSFVFVDECFIELAGQSKASVIKHVKDFENLIVLRSLTKSFGLPGIRIGYATACTQIAETLTRIKIPWSINTLAQISVLAALKCQDHIKISRKIICDEYQYLCKEINTIPGFYCYKSTANFILVRTTLDSTYIQQQLLKSNILVRDCKNFDGLSEDCIRIAIRTHKDNLKLVHALENIR